MVNIYTSNLLIQLTIGLNYSILSRKGYLTLCKVNFTFEPIIFTTLNLNNNIKKLRFEKDQISQEHLAKALNVSRQTINAIENRRFNPSIFLVLQMARYLNKKVEEIFFLEE